MGRMRAAIKASAKARKEGKLPPQLRVCWGGPENLDCKNDAQGLVDAEEYPCCSQHGGKTLAEWKETDRD